MCVMAEPRRVQLTSLSSDGQPPGRRPPSGASQGRETRPSPPAESDAVRLVLALFEPDARSFPEFSYGQLFDDKVGFFLDVYKTHNLEAAAATRLLKSFKLKSLQHLS